MKLHHAFLCGGIALLCGGRALGQTSQSDEIAALRKQLEALANKVEELQQQVNKTRLAPVFGGTASTDTGKSVVPAEPSTSYTPPRETNLAIFNPEISAAVDFIGSYSQRADNANFIVRDAEIMIQSNVDQFAHAYAVFNAETELNPPVKTDPFDDINLHVEEAAIETTALPLGFGVKAGQFFADFTRLGKIHSHDLPFTDRPRSLDRIVGGETKARGAEFSWVPPIGHYIRLTAGAVDDIGANVPITSQYGLLGGQDESAFAYDRGVHRSFSDVTYYGRAATIFELGPQANLSVGGDYAQGRDRGRRQVASGDFKLSWTPRPDSYDLFELSGEYLWGQNSGTFSSDVLPDEGASGTSSANGGYVYAQYRFGKMWQPGVRYDYTHSNGFAQRDTDGDGQPDGTLRLSDNVRTYTAYLTCYLSEFNRLRLEASYITGDHDFIAGGRNDWQFLLQWTITLGPHKHPFSP